MLYVSKGFVMSGLALRRAAALPAAPAGGSAPAQRRPAGDGWDDP